VWPFRKIFLPAALPEFDLAIPDEFFADTPLLKATMDRITNLEMEEFRKEIPIMFKRADLFAKFFSGQFVPVVRCYKPFRIPFKWKESTPA
jgi:hypothetical protein